jgi:ADP-ribosyl-[dinitrogen reductase] hydrolase
VSTSHLLFADIASVSADLSEDRFLGCLIGLAAGDALGTTVEFARRGTFDPVTDIIGGGPFNLKPGQWTDDTSMALCLAESLLECNGFDPADQQARYWRWLTEGYFSSTGTCFDIGNTVRAAMYGFQEHGRPYAGSTDPKTAGNGCIMRLAPVPMFYSARHSHAVKRCADSSRTTHGAPQCLDASRLFGSMLVRALGGASKEQLLFGNGHLDVRDPQIEDIADGCYVTKVEFEILSSGYVVDSLEAALWCFYESTCFKDAVILAANLGGDADTVAAITGQIAGAHYGFQSIPPEWLERISHRELIENFARRLHAAALTRSIN